MGTSDSLARIEAATLAGGDNNQDRYAYGDGWAFVLDGASSFSQATPVHDGGWYAERLRSALAERLASTHEAETADIVAQAIRAASSAHDESTQGPCPTSTISLTRWNAESVELYALGDSQAVAFSFFGQVSVLTDDRIKQFGNAHRVESRLRMANGSGFDTHHRTLLSALQAEQARVRNTPEGYWIAGGQPSAAKQAHQAHLSRSGVSQVILATDGLTTLGDPDWTDFAGKSGCDLTESLAELQHIETSDPEGTRYPRSKAHDDKTVLTIAF